MIEHPSSEHTDYLRWLAEMKTQNKGWVGRSTEAGLYPEETQTLLHELQVHQTELELQNEELRQRHLELEIAWSRYFDLYDLAPVGYFTLDDLRIIQAINLTAANLLDAARGSFIGKPFSRFIHPEDLHLFYHLGERLAEPRVHQTCELRLLKADATPVWVRLEMATLRESDGTFSMRGTFSDISEQVRDRAERERMAERLAQLQKLEAVGVLAAGVAHNMNNVLTAIYGYSQLGEMRAKDSFDLEAFKVISKASERGRDIVASLLQFVRPQPPVMAPMELNSQLREIGHLLEQSTQPGTSLVLNLCEEPLWLEGDPATLSQAIMNLCVNALDAMPGGGTLTFRTSATASDGILLEVVDTGDGMTPDVLARVMEPFYTTKPVGKGTGLGLSMSHGVIKAHGGSMEITSQPREGTSVSIRLPRISPVLDGEPSPESQRFLGALKILFVDDEETILNAFALLLEMEGFEIQTAGSAQEALDSLATHGVPDLIILDVNMPGMDGDEALPRIREIAPTVPVLFSSGRQDLFDLTCLREPHVTAISKPYSIREIRAKLEEMGFPGKHAANLPTT